MCEIMNAIFVLRSGCAWRMIPVSETRLRHQAGRVTPCLCDPCRTTAQGRFRPSGHRIKAGRQVSDSNNSPKCRVDEPEGDKIFAFQVHMQHRSFWSLLD
jgi:hypothetical protein